MRKQERKPRRVGGENCRRYDTWTFAAKFRNSNSILSSDVDSVA